jgi:hypothetical protein
MGRLLYMAIVSLDGYVADDQGRYDWATPDDEVFGFVNEFERAWSTSATWSSRRSWWEAARGHSPATCACRSSWWTNVVSATA